MKRICMICVLVSSCLYIHGQISTNEKPVSFDIDKRSLIKKTDIASEKTMPLIDLKKLRQEDAEEESKGIPPRFGYRHKVDYDLTNSGTWYTLPDGGKLWQLDIHCPKALSVNLLYDKF